MTCFIAQNLLSEFMDGALEPARSAELSGHIQGCANCTRELAQIRRVRTMLRGLPVERAPSDLLAKIRARVEHKTFLQRLTEAAGGFRIPRLALSGGLATAALAFLAFTVMFNGKTNRAPSGSASRLAENDRAAGRSAGLSVDDGESFESDKLVANAELGRDQDVAGKSVLPAPPPNLAQGQLAASTPAPTPAAVALLDKQMPKAAMHSSAGPDSPEPLSIDGRMQDPNKGAAMGGKNGYVAPDAKVASAKPVATSTPMTVAMAKTPMPTAPPVAAPNEPGLYYKADATPRRKEQQNDAAREEEPAFSSSVDGAPANADGGVATRGDVSKSSENEKKTKVAQKPPTVDTTTVASNQPSTSTTVTGGERTTAPGAGAAGGGDAWGGVATGSGAKDEVNSQTESRPADDVSSAPQAEVVTATGTTDTKSNAMPARWTSASATGPMDLIEAARAAGGRVISPSGTPPSLGKSGASTIVTVEIPASGWAAFSQKLKDTGTFEMTSDVPAGKVRIRVEVVKK